jgi:ribosomal protein L21E
VENWTGVDSLPASLGKSPTEFLEQLQLNLKTIHGLAGDHADREQRRYVTQYNARSRDKHFQVGQQVIVLLPDTSNKLMSRWQGPATVVEIKSPYSYLVELDSGQRRILHANRLVTLSQAC